MHGRIACMANQDDKAVVAPQSVHGLTLYVLNRYWDGIYVLYTYAAQRKTSQTVQKLLSTPIVGSEKNVLRHMTFIN